MPSSVHVFDFLQSKDAPPAVCVTFGDESFLKQLSRRHIRELVLGKDSEAPYSLFDGSACEWRDVADELATVSLFGDTARLVIVEQADPFVSKYRDRLEQYVEKPKSTGTMLLDVEAWPKNTRLFKLVAKAGLQVECRAPEKAVGSRKVPDDARLLKWIVSWAKSTHSVKLSKTAAEELLALVGPTFGMLDQEIAKLALFANEKNEVDVETVEKVVGGWRAQTIWDLIDAATEGKTADALEQLSHLLASGEHPVALFGQIAWSLRRFAAATRIYQFHERQRRRVKLTDALVEAGFPHWNRKALGRAEQQLKQLGRHRAGRLYRWLLETDLALKGTHSSPHRARFALERLIFQMAPR